jgi:ADP-ribose pyrophosphatase YjhB (NUDIX family)
MHPKVRVSGILMKNNRILLVEQKVPESQNRGWSLPGGALECNESIEACLIREMAEESGLKVAVQELIYVCDRIEDGRHIVHITFFVQRIGGEIVCGIEPEKNAYPISDVRMVAVNKLREYGFSGIFQALAEKGFPNKGTYQGAISNIGL